MSTGSVSQRTRIQSLVYRGTLLLTFVRREVLGRYRGSVLGLMWSLLAPLLMLAVYTFAFHDLMGLRWPDAKSRGGFATMVFAGMIVHGMFAECIGRAPVSIVGNPNFVKKVVFPLTVLPLVSLGSALFHGVLSFIVLGAFAWTTGQEVHWTSVFLPLVLLPYLSLLAGLAWMLAALGVFVRDIVQVTGMIATIFLFLSPVLYLSSSVPERYAGFLAINPLTLIIEQVRATIFAGMLPDFKALLMYGVFSLLFAAFGLMVFRKLRRGFADVL